MLFEDIMIKVLIYGYMCGTYSSRKIETYCRRDINFMYLLENYTAPDHSTIARFRKNMPETIEAVFYKIVEKLLEKGEISGKNIFIDGTLKIVHHSMDGFEEFLTRIEEIGKKFNISFVMSVSIDADTAPDYIKKYV